MHIRRYLFAAAVVATAGAVGPAAEADRIDRVVTTIAPAAYDGPCPVTIKLEGAVIFDVARNNQENYAYHWATVDQQLTDDVKAFSKGRTNHVESSIQLQEPVGAPATIPITLHAYKLVSEGTSEFFRYSKSYRNDQVKDYPSLPANLTITCR